MAYNIFRSVEFGKMVFLTNVTSMKEKEDGWVKRDIPEINTYFRVYTNKITFQLGSIFMLIINYLRFYKIFPILSPKRNINLS